MPQEFHPVVWLHFPLCRETGAVGNLSNWDVPAILGIIAATTQCLGDRKRGQAPTGLP